MVRCIELVMGGRNHYGPAIIGNNYWVTDEWATIQARSYPGFLTGRGKIVALVSRPAVRWVSRPAD
jgi:hypothetical protein